mgnify:CR=1 FL=1
MYHNDVYTDTPNMVIEIDEISNASTHSMECTGLTGTDNDTGSGSGVKNSLLDSHIKQDSDSGQDPEQGQGLTQGLTQGQDVCIDKDLFQPCLDHSRDGDDGDNMEVEVEATSAPTPTPTPTSTPRLLVDVTRAQLDAYWDNWRENMDGGVDKPADYDIDSYRPLPSNQNQWTPLEDRRVMERFYELSQQPGKFKWPQVAEAVPGRTGTTTMTRWNRVLHPKWREYWCNKHATADVELSMCICIYVCACCRTITL